MLAPPSSLTLFLRTVAVLAARDLRRLVRQKTRFVTTLLSPVVILLAFGAGYGAMLQAGSQYRTFLLAGMVFQSVIFSASISASSLIWDREYGFLRVCTLAPVPERYLALGTVFGAGLQACVHGGFFLLAAPLLGIWLGPARILGALGVTFLLGLGVSGLFLAVASRTRTWEDFSAVSVFFSVPLIFLSGTHFPVMELPGWLRVISRYNPATYGVDLLKHLFVAPDNQSRWTPDFAVSLDLPILLVFTFVLVTASVAAFRLRER